MLRHIRGYRLERVGKAKYEVCVYKGYRRKRLWISTFLKIGRMRIKQVCASERIIFSFDSKGETQAEQFIRNVPKYKQAPPPVIDVEFYANKR